MKDIKYNSSDLNFKVILTISLLFIAAISFGQSNPVRFENDLNWKEILEKAKSNRKYIFVDLYATWCKPCKEMDNNVYSNDTIGNILNPKFISVKVQMDQTSNDNQRVIKWYSAAKKMGETYLIEGYPTFLFFNSDGQLIYKEIGYKSVPVFLKVINSAIDSITYSKNQEIASFIAGNRNIPNLDQLSKYVKQHGNSILSKEMANAYVSNLSAEELIRKPNIIFIADFSGRPKLADSLASKYFTEVILRMPLDSFFTRWNLDFINKFRSQIHLDDSIFRVVYDSLTKINLVAKRKGWAEALLTEILNKDLLSKALIKEGRPIYLRPDWDELEVTIKTKYPELDNKSIIQNYQIFYYRQIGEWQTWAFYKDLKIRQIFPSLQGFEFTMELNEGGAWDVFLHCNDTVVLTKALEWIDLAIDKKKLTGEYVSGYMDTKANLLYKLGRVAESLACQDQAIAYANSFAQMNSTNLDKLIDSFKRIKETMKQGGPTYLDEGAIWDKESILRIKKYNIR